LIPFRYFLASAIAGILLGCSSTDPKAEGVSYFDSQGFFEKEIATLSAEKKGYRKTLKINGKTDAFNNRKVNWKEELEIFRNIKLNKPAYNGKFKATSSQEGNVRSVYYTSTDPKIPVRNFHLLSIDGHPHGIEITTKENSLVYSSSTYLKYVVNEGYQIKGTQTLKGLEPSTFSINAIFLQ